MNIQYMDTQNEYTFSALIYTLNLQDIQTQQNIQDRGIHWNIQDMVTHQYVSTRIYHEYTVRGYAT